MTRIQIERPSNAKAVMDGLTSALTRRLEADTLRACPVEFAQAMVNACATQSCGKCTPCRIGLQQLDKLVTKVLDGRANAADIDQIEALSRDIYYTADCAIGYEAAAQMLQAVTKFRADFEFHAAHRDCSMRTNAAIPCMAGCPAHVDIPGYIALVKAGRFQDAVRLIRKDNPFALACGLICEHPCEESCRRSIVDAPINIRMLKRFAVENSESDYTPFHHEPTGKTVAIIGGGPSGMTAAYFLALMGHKPTVFEQRQHLGGMMRYGIPAYRFPREQLQSEIDFLVAQGIEVKTGVSVPRDIPFEEIREQFDAVYVAIGAHNAKSLGLEGETAEGVLSAIDLLGAVGDGFEQDFTGLDVAIIGGGNVAMDAARTSVRLGAKSVRIIYRRRKLDMTALPEEVEGAIAEGCEVMELHAPVGLAVEDDKVTGVLVAPQIVGAIQGGRTSVSNAAAEAFTVPADRVIVAIGQAIGTEPFEQAGLAANRGKLEGDKFAAVADMPGVFTGGDCESGPATVIRAVAAGKAAARNIDEFLGFNHQIQMEVEVPAYVPTDKAATGRCNAAETEAATRATNMEHIEYGYTNDEAMQEADRCLRCDHCGMGSFRGGRSQQW